jgi:hypothetical protein
VPTPPTPPPSAYPFGMGIPFSLALRRLLPQHHLLAECGDRLPTPLVRQQRTEHRRRGEVSSYLSNEGAARQRPRRTVLQRVLRRVHALVAMLATRGRLPSYPVQVFTEASMPGKYLRYPIGQGGRTAVQPFQFGRTASTTRRPGAPVPVARLARHESNRIRRARTTASSRAASSTPPDGARVCR